jgi:hypothetical protein
MSVDFVSSLPQERSGVIAAIRVASVKTGADFDFLLSTAMRESGLNSQAKAKSSSATGLFQFIDQTWLGLVKRFGARHGLEGLANAIGEDGNGHYQVASEQTKSAILALRKDSGLSALMAGEAASETKKNLECALGREVCEGELYAAHFLGPGNAKKLIALQGERPDCLAAQEFPAAARANKSVFFNADGSAKTVREVYAWATGQSEAARGNIMPQATRSVAGIESLLRPSSVPTQTSEPKFHAGTETASMQPPLKLSLGILEILAAITPFASHALR